MTIQNARSVYEAAAVASITQHFRAPAPAPAPAISDEDRDSEYRAQKIFYTALAIFRSQVQDAAALSELRRDALTDIIAALDDERPDRGAWDEAISTARRS